MYIFFASTGAMSNIVIDDEELRQGNVNVNNVYAYFASRPNISYTGTVTFERSDGLLSPERTMTPATFVYETVSYAGYHFLIDDEWILATYGELKCTVRLRSGAGAVLASGLITANVEQTVYDDEPDITITQYNDLTADIADKASKSQTVIHVATFDDIPYLDCGVYANWLFILDDGSLYRVDTDTATLIGIIGKNVNYVKSSEILAKGDVVQFQNATGGFIQVKKMTPAEVNVYPQLVLGFALQAFTANGFGIILTLGKLDGINTSSGTDGAYVYANTTSSTGLWTVTRPTAPNAIIVLGTISNAAVNGSIDVRLSIIPKLAQLSDVYDPVLAQDDVLKWNGSTLRWEVTRELAYFKYLGSYATEALAVTAIQSGATGVLYELLVNSIPYEGIKTGTSNVTLLDLTRNKATYYASGTVESIRNSIYSFKGTVVDSVANTVPEIYRNSFRSFLNNASNIGVVIVTRGSYGGTPTSEYAQIIITSETKAIVVVGSRIWSYDYTADTFTETYYTKTESDSTFVKLSEKGAPNGVVPLDGSTKIDAVYLPSYVDDILEYNNLASFPVTGETGKIYVAKDTNITYRWSGSAYVEISQSLALGETSATAYRGDRGKTAYDHSQLSDGSNPHGTTFANIASKPTTVGGYGITDALPRTSTLTTTLATAYSTLGRQIAINGTNGSYLLVLFPDSVIGYNGRFYGSDRIGVRSFRQNSGSATIQDAFNDSVAGGGQDCYELITGTAFASLIGVSSIYNQGLYEIKDSSSTTYLYGAKYSLSALGVTLLALPTAIVSGLEAKADKLYATNLITNGDFSNGATGWQMTYASPSVENNVLFITATGGAEYAGAIQISDILTSVTSKKVYAKGILKVTNDACVKVRLVMIGYSGAYEEINVFELNSPTINTVYNVSCVGEFSSGATGPFAIIAREYYATAEIAAGKVLELSYIEAIDLTATFGAGKERTVAEMDSILALKPNSHFNGTAEILPISDMPSVFAMKEQEAWITPTLLNGWASEASHPVKYMKDEMGFVHVKGIVNGTTSNTIVFNFMPGCRPTGYPNFLKTNGAGELIVESLDFAGNVTIASLGLSVSWCSLDGITFKAEA